MSVKNLVTQSGTTFSTEICQRFGGVHAEVLFGISWYISYRYFKMGIRGLGANTEKQIQAVQKNFEELFVQFLKF